MRPSFGRYTAEHGPHLDAGSKQCARLELLEARDLAQVVGLFFGHDVHHLAARHTVVTAGAGERGDQLGTDEGIGAGIGLAQDVESQGMQAIAREHGGRFVEGGVHGGFAVAQFVIVHAGQIIVDERIGMNCFDGAAGIDRGAAVDPEQVGGRDEQQRAHPLAAADRGIAHRLDQPRPGIVGDGKKRVERAVDIGLDPLERVAKQVGQRGNHRHAAPPASKGSVPAGLPSAPATIFSIRACAASSRAWHALRSFSPRS